MKYDSALRLTCSFVTGLLINACGLTDGLHPSVPPQAPGNHLSGDISGQPLNVQSAIYATSTNAPGPNSHATVVVMSDQNDLCDVLTRNAVTKDATLTVVYVPDIQTGTFSASSTAALFGKEALVGFARLDGSCQNTVDTQDATASNGAVDVTQLDAVAGAESRAQGSLSVSVGPQNSTIAGSFDASFCPALENMQQILAASNLLGEAGSGSATPTLTCE